MSQSAIYFRSVFPLCLRRSNSHKSALCEIKTRKLSLVPSLATGNNITTTESRRWATFNNNKGSGSNKKQAMQRQRQQNDDASSHHPTADPSTASSPSKGFREVQPTTTSTPLSSFGRVASPAGTINTSLDLNQWEPPKSNKMISNLGSSSPSLTQQDFDLLFDKDAMFDPKIHLPYARTDWKGYEPATPLTAFLMQRIGVSGQPISTAEFMRHALTHPLYGYYTTPPKSDLEKTLQTGDDDWDVNDIASSSTTNNTSTIIGPRGDFVTAPEVSHVFGHCICVWFVTQWQQQLAKSENIQLLELGPGRGTLMVDILQLATTSKLIDFGSAIHTVHFVEASRALRLEQQQSLEKALGHLVHFEFTTTSNNTGANDDNIQVPNKESPMKIEEKKIHIRVEWHDDFASFQRKRDKKMPVLMVLQEFLDALPVHVFQMTEDGWRERLVDVASALDDDDDQEDTNKDKATTTSTTTLSPRLRQILAPGPTPATDLFLGGDNKGYSQKDTSIGTVIEVCPEALLLVQDMANVLEESDGAALIIDYGQEGTADTLRAFSNHKQVPLTSYPGQVDVTADVDFYALKRCLEQKDAQNIHAFGPVTQGEFLMRMGAGDMVIKSIEEPTTTEEEAHRLSDALKYLVLPEHMGEKYKVMAFGKKRDGIFAPPGIER